MATDVAELPAARLVRNLGDLLRLWQNEGFGRLIEEGTNADQWRYHFTPSGKAKIMAKLIGQRRKSSKFLARIGRTNWNAVSAVATVFATLASIAALIVSIIALGRS